MTNSDILFCNEFATQFECLQAVDIGPPATGRNVSTTKDFEFVIQTTHMCGVYFIAFKPFSK